MADSSQGRVALDTHTLPGQRQWPVEQKHSTTAAAFLFFKQTLMHEAEGPGPGSEQQSCNQNLPLSRPRVQPEESGLAVGSYLREHNRCT